MQSPVNWTDYSGASPEYFTPFNIDYPVAPQSTWPTGGTARWPDGSGPSAGKIVVAGSDDVSRYNPDKDILVFGFRDGSGGVLEMNAHNYCVLWERTGPDTVTLHVMPVSRFESTTPIASIENLTLSELPTLVESWAPTNNHFQDDLVSSVFALTRADEIPDNHIAIFTHEAGVTTTYDYAALSAAHDTVVLNAVTMTGRELDASYDPATQTLTIRHFGEDWGGYNDVWGETVITSITPEDLSNLDMLWRRDAALEDGRLLKGRFEAFLADLSGNDSTPPGDHGDDGAHNDGDHGDDGHDGGDGHDHGDGTGTGSTPGDYALTIQSIWETGFVAEYAFSPTEDVNDWRVTLAFDGDITSIWNAEVLATDGNTVTLGPKDYNTALAAGSTTTFGFVATGNDTDIMVIEEASEPPELTTSLVVVEDRGNRAILELTITNHLDTLVDDWTLTFEAPFRIKDIEGASGAVRRGTALLEDDPATPLAQHESVTITMKVRRRDLDIDAFVTETADDLTFI
ncbi:MAG: cellulose binding domain-containing protein [Pseudomonadota bacterium]